MASLLVQVVIWLAVAIALIVAADVVTRLVVRRRERQDNRLRPKAELALADYLAGSAVLPEVTGTGERAVLLKVALEALADLRGSERARLTDLLERLGYVAQASSALGGRGRASLRRAAETLAVIATGATMPALIAGLADRDALVRCTCAGALVEVVGDVRPAGSGTDEVSAAIIAVVEHDMDITPGPCSAVLLALGVHRPSALAPSLMPGRSRQVRLVAIEVAGALRLAEHAPLLQQCLREADDLAAAAARGLGQIGEVRSVQALIGLGGDAGRSGPARAAALTALGSIGDPQALPVLRTQLQDGDWQIRAAAVGALAQLGEEGTAALSRAAESGRPEVRLQAEAALQP